MWRFVEAKAIGSSHRRANLPCQDRLSGEQLENDSFVAALADGAGSAAKADVGAEIAVNAVMAYLKSAVLANRTDFELLLREAATAARAEIAARAKESGDLPRAYASTLLAVILTPHGGGALQVGDGVIVVNDADDDWCWVFWPQRGEYANTTHFLTDEDMINQLEVTSFSHKVCDVALTSDGLESLALHYASRSVHIPFFKGLFQPLLFSAQLGEDKGLSASLEEFLSSERVMSRTDDDVSIVLATRRTIEKIK